VLGPLLEDMQTVSIIVPPALEELFASKKIATPDAMLSKIPVKVFLFINIVTNFHKLMGSFF
jgi:hypothetical protein